MASTQKEVVFITGANTGIGLEAVKALAKSSKPYDIVIGSRQIANAEDAIRLLEAEIPSTSSAFHTQAIDIASDESIFAARDQLTTRFGRIDVLINNAGASFDLKLQSGELSMREVWNKAWDVNVTGTTVLTHELVPLLLKSSNPRLLFLTSGTASCAETEDLTSPISQRINGSPDAGWPKPTGPNPIAAYRSTKTGLNMVMREWYRLLRNDGVKVWAISPGFLVTGLGGVGTENLRKMGARDPSIGGEFIKTVVEGQRDADQGKAIRENMIQPW